MAAGILAALFVSYRLAISRGLSSAYVFDVAFWVIIGGILGARIYEVLAVNPQYYFANPLNIVKIWEGGLAIHGAIIGGIIALLAFVRLDKQDSKTSFFSRIIDLLGIFSLSLPLGQAIGRWGNYFNQEIFGRPTDLPWGIPIDIINRPADFLNAEFFHPVFLYESLGCFFIFFLLNAIYYRFLLTEKKNKALGALKVKKERDIFVYIIPLYFILYSILRFLLEFIRLDETPNLFGWRLPQIVSLVTIIASLLLFIVLYFNHEKTKSSA